jgi:hypothetical protein
MQEPKFDLWYTNLCILTKKVKFQSLSYLTKTNEKNLFGCILRCLWFNSPEACSGFIIFVVILLFASPVFLSSIGTPCTNGYYFIFNRFSFLSGKEKMLLVQMATCFWNVFFSYELISSPFSGYFHLEWHGQMK